MKRSCKILGITSLAVIAVVIMFIPKDYESIEYNIYPAQKVKSSYSPKSAPSTAIEREQFFFDMLRDPAQNKIPRGIRVKELNKYQSILKSQLKSAESSTYTWTEVGPYDVGGRTRALAIDVRNSNVLLAGGVSGGIWKSTDKGESWTLKNSPDETFSVTSICQDPRTGHQDTWYYSSGEFDSNSADATGASFYGHGIYKSTDNGETWSMILGNGTNPYDWDSVFDYISKIKVDPFNGELYIAANGYGLMLMEPDTFKVFMAIGNSNDHYYCDFDIDANGNILCVLSEYGYNKYYEEPPVVQQNAPGVYYAHKGTYTYTQIDPGSATFPDTHELSLVRFAPSDTTTGYVYTHAGNEKVAFHKIDIENDKLIDRSANLPVYNDYTGKLITQDNYNMTLAVKPDDPDFIIIGGTSLFRSKDGFSTSPVKNYSWIGGFNPKGGNTNYKNHHVDCHITLFDPADANAVWSGHDGGLSYVNNISQTTSATSPMSWVDKNNGYNVTQFYTFADIVKANDNRYIGGAQDNGTPSFNWDGTAGTSSDISSGDGGFCYLANNYAYVSSQNGSIMRTGYDIYGNPLNPYTDGSAWSIITPADATGQLFINPFAVNPNNENVMYYAAGPDVWINTAIESIPDEEIKTTEGWLAPETLKVPGYTVSALTVSKVPGNILYYAAYSWSGMPKIFKVENSTLGEENLIREEISIPDATPGSYPYYIAVNPKDANEIIVVFSNYGVPSIFYSNNGGQNYSLVDGNLTATDEVPGPSVRSAAILNWNGKKSYYISTSIGVYKTDQLNGTSTIWETVAPDKLGNVVCNMIKTSDFDGKIVAATHGRGIFKGSSSNPLFIDNTLPNMYRLLSSPDETIDISNVFEHDSDQNIDVTVISNSDPSIVSYAHAGSDLNLEFSDINEGTSVITLRGTYGTNIVEMAFSVTVSEDGSANYVPVNKEEKTGMSVYPNPSNGMFKLSLSGYKLDNSIVSIYTLYGQQIFSQDFSTTDELTNHMFNLSGRAAGTYIVQIKTEEITKNLKVIKR